MATDVNQTFCGDHFTIYTLTNIKSCTSEINVMCQLYWLTLKIKLSYCTSKNGFIWKEQRIAIQCHRQVPRAKQRNTVLQRRGGKLGRALINKKKSIGVTWEFEVQWPFLGSVVSLSLAGLLLGQEENLPSSCWVAKSVLSCKVLIFPLGKEFQMNGKGARAPHFDPRAHVSEVSLH